MSENQYWINQDGVQAGPVSREELEKMSLTDAAYVWRAGMADWVRITEMSELAGCYTISGATPSQPTVAIPDEPVVDGDAFVAGEPVAQPVPPVIPDSAAEPVVAGTPMSQPVAPAIPQLPAENPKCPPTNLVWAILATVLCCLPLGVVAIIYSTKVSQKYNEGDLAAAEHYSEVSAWWCIGTIVGGIILSPFVSLIQMALMG